jgi:predicted metalloprotease
VENMEVKNSIYVNTRSITFPFSIGEKNTIIISNNEKLLFLSIYLSLAAQIQINEKKRETQSITCKKKVLKY